MRKTHLITGLFAIAAACAFGSRASADLIVNGDFSLGNVGFTSGYIEDSSAGAGYTAGANEGAGYYGIVADSQYWHPLFADFQDHTQDGSAASDPSNTSANPDAGYMMIVNGDNTPGTTVWSESNIDVTPGAQYQLTFWAAAAYPVSPASLDVTASVNAANQTFNLTGDAGVWHEFTMDFTATNSPTTISLSDTNLDLSGNDFALDDISLVQLPANAPVVPVPASSLGGGLLLAGVAIANKIRRRRMI